MAFQGCEKQRRVELSERENELLRYLARNAGRAISREEILSRTTFEFEPAAASEWLFFARTALGEWILDTSLKWRFDKYRTHRRMLEGQELEHRYDIPGGANFLDNCRDFLVRHAQKTDGIAFYETYNDAQMQVINNYLFALEHLNVYCREHGMRLIFVYYPEYPEIYMPERHPALPDILREACAAQRIPFLNLTGAFRGQGNRVLHFAPLDYHPNPGGNRVMAQAIADFLVKEHFPHIQDPKQTP